ncbi:cholinesterase-like [Dreissena polymorpha]|uniref:Carboxylic ester hydrolase n=1 Tax=Dreissena polymorpha TaxID=45954 RepID=A0A9D4FAI5_DREPO|nr:cholinesterase-like [Dreissena polymorpha]KAH3794727.1 hypothetical protein DPMN_148265 [Dreissena polymorpha]
MANVFQIVFCVGLYVVLSAAQGPSVTTSYGEIRGVYGEVVYTNPAMITVHRYLGIPFANPPVGDLRFRKPERLTMLKTPYNASAFGFTCPQLGDALPKTPLESQSEDCLFLNVVVPDRSPAPDKDHAVMVFFYGGGFTTGSSTTYDAQFLAAYGNVIIVTANYRVGPFGFMSTEDENCPGNFGLWDQQLALQWVSSNIASFGGDPKRVTIFGESAGAISCSYQAMYPPNRGLFQNVITQSGTFANTLSVPVPNARKYALRLANQLGCASDNTLHAMECLRKVAWKDLNDALVLLGKTDPTFTMFSPAVDGDIVKGHPLQLLAMHQNKYMEEVEFFRSLHYLNGVNQFEGAFMFPILGNPAAKNLEESLSTFFYAIGVSPARKALVAAVVHEYKNWNRPFNTQEVPLQTVRIFGDSTFGASAVEALLMHEAGPANSYAYRFMPRPSVNIMGTPDWVPGANHADELGFVFALGMLLQQPWEVQMATHLVTYWSNFAKTGNPNTPSTPSVMWPVYNKVNMTYIELDKDAVTAKHYFLAKEHHFWNNVMALNMESMDSNKCDIPVAAAASLMTSFVSKMVAGVAMLFAALLFKAF